MGVDVDAVVRSYRRCLYSDTFLDTFYDRFLSSSEEVAEKFKHTDFKHQKLMLRQSLLTMLLFNLDASDAREELDELAKRHSRNGVDIAPRLYDLWLDTLCDTVEIHDPEYTPEIGEKWRTAMQAGIELLVSRY